MDNAKPLWCNWCRLCAKENPDNSISINLGEQSHATRDEIKFSLKQTLEKYFCIKVQVQMPFILCGDCYSFLSSLLRFSQRVQKVQRMYNHLMQTGDSSDLNAIRLKFDVLDDYTQLGCKELAMSEVVVPISFQDVQTDCSTIFIVKHEGLATNQIDYDEEPLECEAPEDEDDPFETMTDFNMCNFSNSSSEEDEKPTRRKRRKRRSRIKKDPSTQENEKEGDTTVSGCNEFKRSGDISDSIEYKLSNSLSDDDKDVTKTRGKTRGRKRKIHKDTQIDEKHVDSMSGCKESNQSDSEKLVRMKKRDINRKKKDEFRIDYTMDAACPVCNEKFVLFSTYCQHMLSSHVNNEWKCITCNRALQCRYDFERHLRKHLPKNSIIKHICTICGLELSCSTTLKRHLSVHSDKMQHLCEHCGRAFKRDTTLKAHMILHTGLKPYSCNYCQLSFACSSNCRRHMRKAHSEEFAALQTFGNKPHTKTTS